VGYNSGDFPLLWDTTENNLRMVGNFSCIVSHNIKGYVPLWDTTQEVFLHCIPQRRCFSSIVQYLTSQKKLLCCFQQRKLWDTAEKNYTTQNKNV
jgi:hypothetical protein